MAAKSEILAMRVSPEARGSTGSRQRGVPRSSARQRGYAWLYQLLRDIFIYAV
jgi:hypothetical protein